MVEQERHIDTTDGRTNIFDVYPHAEECHGTVLFCMDVPGIREDLRDMARRIAAEGYFVVLPNRY